MKSALVIFRASSRDATPSIARNAGLPSTIRPALVRDVDPLVEIAHEAAQRLGVVETGEPAGHGRRNPITNRPPACQGAGRTDRSFSFCARARPRLTTSFQGKSAPGSSFRSGAMCWCPAIQGASISNIAVRTPTSRTTVSTCGGREGIPVAVARDLDADGRAVQGHAPVEERDARVPRAVLERDELEEAAVAADEEVRRDPALGLLEERDALLVGVLRRVVENERRDRLDLERLVALPPGVRHRDEAGVRHVSARGAPEIPEAAVRVAEDAVEVKGVGIRPGLGERHLHRAARAA